MYVYILFDDECVEIIGVYSTEEKARDTLDSMKDYRYEMHIEKWELNKEE